MDMKDFTEEQIEIITNRVTFDADNVITLKRIEQRKQAVYITYDSYNKRRYSRPWAAMMSLRNNKLSYDFCGQFTGEHGDAGKVVIKVRENDVVCFGQKDNRGNNTTKNFYRIDSDFDMREMSQTEAYDLLESYSQCEEG